MLRVEDGAEGRSTGPTRRLLVLIPVGGAGMWTRTVAVEVVRKGRMWKVCWRYRAV